MDIDTDPLEITAADGLCLFGDSASNIEFVIESDEEPAPEERDLGTKENPYVIQIAEITESVNQPDAAGVSKGTHETIEVIDLDASSDEEIKEEIEIEEGELKAFEIEKECELPKGTPKNTANDKGNSVNPLRALNTLCYVPNCTIDEKEKDKILWFKAPFDKNTKKIWDICIDRTDKRLSSEDIICSQHFADSDVVYNISNKNGIVMNAGLKDGAVPCIKFHERCCVPFCESKTGNMYCFPVLRTSNFHLWLYMIRNADLKKLKMKDVLRHRVCVRHFEKDCFEDASTLKSTAAPTLHLPEVSLISINSMMNPEQRLEAVDVSKCKLCCAYGVCSNTNANKKMFRFPENPDRCIAWLKACKRSGLITSPQGTVKRMSAGYLGVCEDHFQEQHFDSPSTLTFNAIPISDGAPPRPVVKKIQPVTSSETLQKYYAKKEELAKDIKPSGFTGICSYKDCYLKVSANNPFFSFPVDEARSAKWLDACGLVMSSPMLRHQILKNQRICSQHFMSNMFESKYKLKTDAVPISYANVQSELRTSESESAAQEGNKNFSGKKICCAVKFCLVSYISRYGKGAFPIPSIDRERFDIWVKLVDNKALNNMSAEDIKANYMVCLKHFENFFYMRNGKVSSMSDEAVPTRQLSANSQWFLTSSYYENRLKTFLETCGIAGFKCTPSGLLPISGIVENEFSEELEDPTDDVEEVLGDESTVCILENEGIRFPKSGHYLPVQSNPNLKRKFPYNVYKLHKAGYGLNNEVIVGEHIKIHTAIIIDDDDECERQVLQQLLDKKKRTV